MKDGTDSFQRLRRIVSDDKQGQCTACRSEGERAMNPSSYTEDTLIQQTTADYLEQQLGWESIYAYNNEDFCSGSLSRLMNKEATP